MAATTTYRYAVSAFDFVGNESARSAALSVTTTTSSVSRIHYVSLSGAHIAPYTNWQTAARNIQAAIRVAAAGDTVLVTNGVYASGGAVVYGSLTNRIAIIKPIAVRSVNGPTVTVIKGQGPYGDAAVRFVVRMWEATHASSVSH